MVHLRPYLTRFIDLHHKDTKTEQTRLASNLGEGCDLFNVQVDVSGLDTYL